MKFKRQLFKGVLLSIAVLCGAAASASAVNMDPQSIETRASQYISFARATVVKQSSTSGYVQYSVAATMMPTRIGAAAVFLYDETDGISYMLNAYTGSDSLYYMATSSFNKFKPGHSYYAIVTCIVEGPGGGDALTVYSPSITF